MCDYAVRGVDGTVISRVCTYEQQVARYFARPASSMVELRRTWRCVVVGKEESFIYLVAIALENYSRDGTFMTPENVKTYAKNR